MIDWKSRRSRDVDYDRLQVYCRRLYAEDYSIFVTLLENSHEFKI